MIPRDKIIEANPIARYLDDIGHTVKVSGEKGVAKCPFHDDKSPSMSVQLAKGLWHCFACDIGGTVVDMHMRRNGLTVKDALSQLAQRANLRDDDAARPVKAATYVYRDSLGREVMRVDRIQTGEKKKFRQYTVAADGAENNGVDGVARVLFRMERWAGKDAVALCEGEKCVAALEKLGMDATTNPGGSSAWCDAYAQYLVGKRVEVWPDSDEAGGKWLDTVLRSLEGKVAAIRIMRVPAPYNDVADMVIAKGEEYAGDTVIKIAEASSWIDKGVQLPLLSSREAYEIYRKRITDPGFKAVDLSRWLPSFHSWARPLMPGDLIVVLADTGVGKTTILLNIGYSQRPLPVIMFELELATEAMVERFIARDQKTDALDVERETRQGKRFDVSGWDNIYLCPDSKVNAKMMEDIIERAELKIGARPALVMVDYIGLMDGPQGKRYERMSTIAEDMKRLARQTNTVICLASQVTRKEDRMEVDLHAAKDSGSIENSAQLVLGAWRPQVDRMTIRILKQTKRAGGHDVHCLYDGDKQLIREVAHV